MKRYSQKRGYNGISEYLEVDTIKGKHTEIVYNVNDFPYRKLLTMPTVRKKGKQNVTYYNVSCAFDIETTTIDGDKDTKGKYKVNPYAFMYHWQACIDGHTIFGRYWYEFTQFLKNLKERLDLSDNKRLVFYVHNLAYEFQFMRNFIPITDIFAKSARKPMYFLSTGFEFRCSYFLSNMSLEKFCENSEMCTHYKLAGKYNYTKLRTPKTQLTKLEKGYCFNDVKGLCECIDTLLQEDTIATIPLTNTGYVRRDFRKAMNTLELRKRFVYTQLTPQMYILCNEAFRGGNTHANRFYAGDVMKEVYSYDITSSYPASMMIDYFPMGKFAKIDLNDKKKFKYYTQNFCVIMRISFKNIRLKKDVPVPYIPIAKCLNKIKYDNDNGRLMNAEFITMSLTEIDFDIINRQYNFEQILIHESYFARRGKLPKEFRQELLKYYDLKTQLKDVTGKEYEYAKSKNRVNSSFGMLVTAIAHGEFLFTHGEWEEVAPDIAKSLEKFYKSKNSFLSYQYGIYVTAQSRKRLQTMLDVVGMDMIYCDTDSIKFIGKEHIAQFESLNKQLQKEAEENDIRAYSERDGKRYYLGVWDFETKKGAYSEFITLGAKKYCYRDIKDNELHITVSGCSKEASKDLNNNINNFHIGFVFDSSGRTVSYFNDLQEQYTEHIKNESFKTGSNIGIVNTTYTLGVTDEYLSLIGA